MFVNRTGDIPKWLNTMRTLINDKEKRLKERNIQGQQCEDEQNQRRADCKKEW